MKTEGFLALLKDLDVRKLPKDWPSFFVLNDFKEYAREGRYIF